MFSQCEFCSNNQEFEEEDCVTESRHRGEVRIYYMICKNCGKKNEVGEIDFSCGTCVLWDLKSKKIRQNSN
jgi:hypothetical protein